MIRRLPLVFTPQPEGGFTVTSPVLPELITEGDTLEEAAYDLGSGPLSTFRQVTLPRLAPAVIAAALLSFTFSFDDYILPAFPNGTTQTGPIVLYSAVRFGITPAVNALASIMLLATFAVVVTTIVMLRRSRVGAKQEKGLAGALGLG